MNQQLKTWQFIASSLERQTAVTLLFVLESKGSSPGRRGFFMAVNAEGAMEGSIGGGIMEHKFVEMAREQLHQSSRANAIRRQFHDKNAPKDQSGMICSGEQTLWLYPVKEDECAVIKKIIESLSHHRNGTLRLHPSGIEFHDTVPSNDFEFTYRNEHDWQYCQKTGLLQQLSIIGGGHCSLALSKLMRSLGFYIRVYDDRPGLKTMEENDSAHEKINVAGYSCLRSLLPEGKDQFVVIMTFGYRTDDEAMRALSGKDFAYIGLLGSRAKIEKMFDSYSEQDIPRAWLDQVHSPIGLPIKSETPEEIAVSIAAEIINVRNRKEE